MALGEDAGKGAAAGVWGYGRSETMSSTPSTITVTNEPDAELVPPPPGAKHISQGVGSGVGSTPGSCVPPADAGRESAPNVSTTAATSDRANFLTKVSPVIEVVDRSGHAPAKIEHDTTHTDHDLTLFRSLADKRQFDKLTDLCRERLLTARNADVSLRWTKDRAIVEALQGKWGAALDLLASAHWLASDVTGAARGRYENEFGLVLVEFNRTSTALSHFRLAISHHRSVGYLRGCAAVRHNAGRAYAVRGETVKAMRCFHRALTYARSVNDYRLEGEVCASLIEFGGGE